MYTFSRTPGTLCLIAAMALHTGSLASGSEAYRKVLLLPTPTAVDGEQARLLDERLEQVLREAAPKKAQLVTTPAAKAEQYASCSAATCISELARGHGADAVVVPGLRRTGTQWVVAIQVLTRDGRTLGQQVLYTGDDERELLGAMTSVAGSAAGLLGWQAETGRTAETGAGDGILSWSTAVLKKSREARGGVPLPRLVVVVTESVDGKPGATQPAESALTKALGEAGFKIVAADVAKKLRQQNAVALMMQGQMPEEVSSIDADLILVGQAEASYAGQAIADVHSYSARLDVKVIRIDSAQTVKVASKEVTAGFFVKGTAARTALEKAGRIVGEQLVKELAALESGPREIELLVHGVPDRAAQKELKSALGGVEAIEQVLVRHSSTQVTKLELVSKLDSEALADRLDELSGLPLEIVQSSRNAILARYDRSRGVRLGLVVADPQGKLTGRDAWLERGLPDLMRADLSNLTYFDVSDKRAALTSYRGGRLAQSEVDRLAQRFPQAQLVLATTFKGAGKKSIVTATLHELEGGTAIFSTREEAAPDQLADAIGRITDKIAKGFLPALARKKSSLTGALGNAAVAAGATSRGKRLVARVLIEAVKLDNLFPAQLAHYRFSPVGSITLRHDDKKVAEARNLRVAVHIPRAMALPSEVELPILKPGRSITLPIQLTLDAGLIMAIEENTPAQAEVTLEYDLESGHQSVKRTVPLVIYGKNALEWSREISVAAFVTPQEQGVRDFTTTALAENLDGKLPTEVKRAIQLFNGLGQLGLRYTPDPVVPSREATLDRVQFARETLTQRTGDCDDLSVLYASVLEATGIEAAMLLVPGHVLVAFAPGPVAQSASSVTFDADRYLAVDHRAWIPVETTLVGRPFEEAWDAGSKALGRWRKQARLVRLRPAWIDHPPMPLPPATTTSRLDARQLATTGVKSVETILARRATELEGRLAQLAKKAQSNNPAALNAYAVALVQAGQLPEARATLDRIKGAHARRPAVQINRANLDILEDRYEQATTAYKQALLGMLFDYDANRIAIADSLNNLGLAYLAAGDEKQAMEAFASAAEAGAPALDEMMGATGGLLLETRAASAEETELEARLKAVLHQALANKKRTAGKITAGKVNRFKELMPTGGRRGVDSSTRVRLIDLLSWQQDLT